MQIFLSKYDVISIKVLKENQNSSQYLVLIVITEQKKFSFFLSKYRSLLHKRSPLLVLVLNIYQNLPAYPLPTQFSKQ